MAQIKTPPANNPLFSFTPLTEEQVSKLLLSSHPTTCPIDPITSAPSNLSYTSSRTHTHIINSSRIFPTAFKQARVTPLLKKSTLSEHITLNKLQTCLSLTIHCKNTCFQPSILFPVPEQSAGCQPIRLQARAFI